MINKIKLKRVFCKHKNGWCAVKKVFVFVDDNENIHIDFKGLFSKSSIRKIKVRCNNPDCKATRNVYMCLNVAKWGRIKYEDEVFGGDKK